MTIEEFLPQQYNLAADNVANGKQIADLTSDEKAMLDEIIASSESSKGVITVVLTSAVYKSLNPTQDIRKHQSSIPQGYSGRTFDTHHITPFLKEHQFPAMAESGWLTRSLEQKVPYDKNYTGAIKPQSLKDAFLNTIEFIETSGKQESVVTYLLQQLILQRDKKQIDLAIPQNLSISKIMTLLEQHFYAKYKSFGASRLPVLALCAIYQCLMNEVKRFDDKVLLPLESHTSADTQSGRKGDIDVVNADNTPFEAVEVKFDIPVSHQIVTTAKQKIQTTTLERYYILSTQPILEADAEKIEADIQQIKNIHGCQLIVNGVLPTIKYYLRLMDNPKQFVENYTKLLATDKTIKFEHKESWNNLVAQL